MREPFLPQTNEYMECNIADYDYTFGDYCKIYEDIEEDGEEGVL